MWACFCWLQKSWVCHLTLKIMPSCPGLTPTPHSIISLIAKSAECSPLHQWKASSGRHLHFREGTFSKSSNTFDFDNNRMWWFFLIWWHLMILKRTGATLCTLTMDIMWLLTLLIVLFLRFAPYLCNCVAGFVSSLMKAFKLQMGCSNWEGNRQEGQGFPNGSNRLQVSDIFISLKQQEETNQWFFFSFLYTFERRFLLKYCVAIMTPGFTWSQLFSNLELTNTFFLRKCLS